MSFSPPVATFYMSVLSGVLIGIFWDIIRVFKKNIYKIKYVNKIIFILDIVFCIVCCVITLSFFYNFTYSGFRWFVLLGELIGWVIYLNTITKPISVILAFLIGYFTKIFIVIFRRIKKIIDIIIIKLKLTKIQITNKNDKMNKSENKKIKKRKITCFYNKIKYIIKKKQ